MDDFKHYYEQLQKIGREIQSADNHYVPGFKKAFAQEMMQYKETELKGERIISLMRLRKEIQSELELVNGNLYRYEANDYIRTKMVDYRNKLKIGLVQVNALINQNIRTPKDLARRYSYFQVLYQSCKNVNIEYIMHPQKIGEELKEQAKHRLP